MGEKHIVIQDHVGRTVIGKVIAEDAMTLTLNNPVFFYVQHQEQTGQIEVKTFPMFFFEFLNKDHRDKNNWTFQKANIVVGDVILEDSIMEKYLAINTPRVEAPVQNNPKVISINDL